LALSGSAREVQYRRPRRGQPCAREAGRFPRKTLNPTRSRDELRRASVPSLGRRRNRKLERRKQQSGDGWLARDLRPVDPETIAFGNGWDRDLEMAFGGYGGRSLSVALAQKTCGGCREFVEDSEGGRGDCLHPGSGIVSPWTDTKACDFYAARRR
jgi:hypothetical protein